MKELNDPSVIRNWEQYRQRQAEQWGKWRANNLDEKHIIAIGKKMYDWDLDKVNEVLQEKGFDKIWEFPWKWDDKYLDF